jgi:uncharacterized protein YndB with AHSA1/START domain
VTDEFGEITKCYTVTYRRKSKHSAARLWRAITEPKEIGKWMGGPAKVDLRVGGEWFVDFPDQGDGDLVGVIVRVEPERVLTFAWGLSVVEWTIRDAERGCTYRFVQTGLADRGPDEEGLAAGWHEFFDRLDRHLEGIYLTDEEHKANWEALKPPYRAQLDAVIR